MKKIVSISLGIVICLLVGMISRLFHAEAMDVWYPVLEKSSLTPPDIVFGIMWGLLYVMMGISVGFLYHSPHSSKKWLLCLFATQLFLNITWNYFFFYLQNPFLGILNLMVLDVLAIVYFIGTWRVKRSSAVFFFPYLLWILFATYLNFYILISN